jgi:RimJ/RimL family protein N-acetyltransferase
MTFYNIIFGILLVAAVGEMLRSLNHPNWLHLWEATSLALLVVSDVIFTSHVIEERKKPYSVSMKFLDLFNFFILSAAIVALDPTDTGYFRVASADRYKFLDGTAVFWWLIVVYWAALVLWNVKCRIYKSVPRGTKWWWQPALGMPLLIMAIAATFAAGNPFTWLWSVIVTISLAAYLGLYKKHILDALSDAMPTSRTPKISLETLTTRDQQEVEQWPPYPPQFMALDYALRPGTGWLDIFPDSKTNHRLAARLNGQLVGFSILSETAPQEAEFYVAIHPERLHCGFGTELTRLTKERGFDQLDLHRIWLKVRTWHEAGIRVYERVGFRTFDKEVEEIAGGRKDRFRKMQIFAN